MDQTVLEIMRRHHPGKTDEELEVIMERDLEIISGSVSGDVKDKVQELKDKRKPVDK